MENLSEMFDSRVKNRGAGINNDALPRMNQTGASPPDMLLFREVEAYHAAENEFVRDWGLIKRAPP